MKSHHLLFTYQIYNLKKVLINSTLQNLDFFPCKYLVIINCHHNFKEDVQILYVFSPLEKIFLDCTVNLQKKTNREAEFFVW